MPDIHRLRVWSARNLKTTSKFILFNTEIYAGNRKGCGFRIAEVDGLYRIDLKQRQIYDADRDRFLPMIESEAISLDPDHILVWDHFPLVSPGKRLSAMLLAIGLLILIVAGVWAAARKQQQHCDPVETALASGDWNFSDHAVLKNLQSLDESFRDAVRSKKFVRARYELEEMRKTFKLAGYPKDADDRCETESGLFERELRWLRAHLKSQSSSSEALRIGITQTKRLQERYPRFRLQDVTAPLFQIARKTYLEGYRWADEDPAKGESLMAEAEAVCKTLQLPLGCWRFPTSKTPSSK